MGLYALVTKDIFERSTRILLRKKRTSNVAPRELNYWALVSDVDPVKRGEWLKKIREKPDVWENRYSH